jgi:predicted NAD/FAD-binding protein
MYKALKNIEKLNMKIAIIGSGISGMGAAYLLNKDHQITVFEKNNYIGGHSRTKNINYNSKNIAVDTGFIVFNHRNYPNLTGMFKLLGVETEKSNMSFGVSADNGKMEWCGASLGGVFAQPKNLFKPAFLKMLFDIVKFNKKAKKTSDENPNLTLGELIEKLNLGEFFQKYYLLPMGGAIWSCPVDQMMQFPAKTFITFFENHGLLTITNQPQWYTVTGGSAEYVKKLTEGFADKIKLNCAVKKVERKNNKIYLTDETETEHEFDEVVFACHADEASKILVDASPDENAFLKSFKYSKNVAYLHNDVNQMPSIEKAWASWIYNKERTSNKDEIAVTYWMNNLQNIDKNYPLFVTLNPAKTIPQPYIFDAHEFWHPIFNADAIAAQTQLENIQGKNKVWFAGAHTRYGFHEDGLLSAVNIAKKIGVKIPWE